MTNTDPTGLDASEFYNSLGKQGSDSSSSAYEQAVAHSLGSSYYQTGTPSGPQSPTVEVPFNWSQGNYDVFGKISNIDTGNNWYNNILDYTLAVPAGVLNLVASVGNIVPNVTGTVIDFLDENVPAWCTATGSVRSDIDGAFFALSVMAPEIAVWQQASAIAAQLKSASAVGREGKVFWSGLGRGGDKSAAEWATRNGGTTLESSLAARGVTLPAWDASNPSVIAAWENASREFAQGASGSVRVLQGETLRTSSIWAKVEFSALTANPNVTSITAINPSTGAEVLLWSK